MKLISAHVNQISRKIHIITMKMRKSINIKKQRPNVREYKVLPCGIFYEKNWNTLKPH